MITKEKLFKHFGSARKLAIALGIDATAIYQWVYIPARRCYEIQELTNGEFLAKDLMELKLKDSPTLEKSRRVRTSKGAQTGR